MQPKNLIDNFLPLPQWKPSPSALNFTSPFKGRGSSANIFAELVRVALKYVIRLNQKIRSRGDAVATVFFGLVEIGIGDLNQFLVFLDLVISG